MSLTPRDREILNSIFECGGLTSLQLATLYFAPKKRGDVLDAATASRTRLKALTDNGFIVPVKPAWRSLHKEHYFYRLGKRGREVLADYLGCDEEELMRRSNTTMTKLPGEHFMRINDFRVALMRAVKDSNGVMELVDWRDETTLRRDHASDLFSITWPDGRQEHNQTLFPDAYMHIYTNTPRAWHTRRFLEIDCGKMTGQSKEPPRDDFAKKIQKYIAYTDKTNGLYRARYESVGIAVLIVTTSDTRLANLKRITEENKGAKRFWFTTFDRITPATVYSAPIWEIAGRDGLFSIDESDKVKVK